MKEEAQDIGHLHAPLVKKKWRNKMGLPEHALYVKKKWRNKMGLPEHALYDLKIYNLTVKGAVKAGEIFWSNPEYYTSTREIIYIAKGQYKNPHLMDIKIWHMIPLKALDYLRDLVKAGIIPVYFEGKG